MNDVSKYFNGSTMDEIKVGKGILEREETPEAVTYFAENQDKLRNYSYWFLLSVCWVSYTGYSDLTLWKKLFGSDRAQRKHSIMKPSEVAKFDCLAYKVNVYRAHRTGEDDWIAYTLDENVVRRFAKERGVDTYTEYQVNKRDILALFLRRGESEIIVLDKNKIKFVQTHHCGLTV
jgi:hypothetical protein